MITINLYEIEVHMSIFGFLCLAKPDSDRICILKPNISQKLGYYIVHVSHLEVHMSIFGFLCLAKPDSDRICILKPNISQKLGYYIVHVSHLGFLSGASI